MNVQGPLPHVPCWISRVVVVLSVLAMATPAAAQQQPVLENGGFGKVRIGMGVKEAERTLGVRFRSLVPGYGPGCWLAGRADGIDPGLSYMVESGQITRIDVVAPQNGAAPAISTAKGIGIGSTRAEVELKYGSSGSSALAPYGRNADDLWVTVETTPALGIVIALSGGKVVSFWAGRRQSIAYTEACS